MRKAKQTEQKKIGREATFRLIDSLDASDEEKEKAKQMIDEVWGV